MLDYIGFGKFQWTISFICGLAWVWNLRFLKRAELSRLLLPDGVLQSVLPLLGAGWRRHGGYYPDHLVLPAALRVEAEELSDGSHVIGKKTDSAGMLVKVGGRHDFPFWLQVVFLAVGIGCPVWGIFCDKYGRKIVSVTPVLFFFSLHVLF